VRAKLALVVHLVIYVVGEQIHQQYYGILMACVIRISCISAQALAMLLKYYRNVRVTADVSTMKKLVKIDVVSNLCNHFAQT